MDGGDVMTPCLLTAAAFFGLGLNYHSMATTPHGYRVGLPSAPIHSRSIRTDGVLVLASRWDVTSLSVGPAMKITRSPSPILRMISSPGIPLMPNNAGIIPTCAAGI